MPDTTHPTGDGATPAPDNPTAGDPLGDPGRKALRAEREKNRALEARIKELEPAAAKAREREDADKSEAQRLTEQLAKAEQARSDAEMRAMRLEVAAEKGLTPAQARRLSGATVEELTADADDLLASFGSPKTPTPPGSRRPREDTRPTTSDDAPAVETDPGKLADQVMAQAF